MYNVYLEYYTNGVVNPGSLITCLDLSSVLFSGHNAYNCTSIDTCTVPGEQEARFAPQDHFGFGSIWRFNRRRPAEIFLVFTITFNTYEAKTMVQ